METERKLTFVVGPTKMGKSTLCNFLISSPLTITKKAFNYKIEALDSQSIGNGCDSMTKEPTFYSDLCDFPGFNDTRGEDIDFNTLCKMVGVLQNYSSFRIIFLAEFTTLESANGSNFINLTKDLIKLFNLQPHHQSSIIMVISKIDKIRIPSISFKEIFETEQNFIIEGLKSETIKCLYFENTVKSGLEYRFKDQNREEILNQIKITNSLKSFEFLCPLYQQLRIMLLSIRENSSTVKFSSKIDMNLIQNIRDEYFCIDQDFELIDQSLIIGSPFILVFPLISSNKIKISLKGNSCLTFLPSIQYFVNYETFTVIYDSSSVVSEFPNPFAPEFDLNEEYFRLESICINSFLNEYASHNNKFLELIMKAKDHSSKLKNFSRYRIKSSMIEIKLKLHINVSMKKKESMIYKYLSMRSCKNIEEYLDKCKKPNHIKILLEKCISNIPTIFQILLENKNVNELRSQKHSNGINAIRSILIQRYLKLIFDIQKQPKQSQNYSKTLKAFNELCSAIPNLDINSISLANKQNIIEIDKFISVGLNKENLDKFLSIFHQIFATEKIHLFEYQITGDASVYSSPEAVRNVQRFNGFNFFGFESANAGNGFFGIAFSLSVRGAIGLSSALASAVGFGFMVADIAVNLALTYFTSGYYPGELDWKDEYGGFDSNI